MSNIKNWTTKKLKFLFSSRMGGAWGDEPVEGNSIVCLRAADFETEKARHKVTDLTRRSYKKDELINKCLEKGDLIIEKSGGGENQPVGRVVRFKLDEPALCSNFLEVLRPKKDELYPQFGAYKLYSLWTSRLTTLSIKQTTGIQNLDISDYLENKVPVPSIELQISISNFLNREIDYIDNLIQAKENQLLLLSEKRQALISHVVTKGLDPKVTLKDTGIDWLGKIPNHWELKKVKHITSKIGSGVTPRGGAEVYSKMGIPLLRSQNIHFDGLRLDDVAFISEKIHSTMANSRVEKGDVLLNITGASIGRCFYFEDQYQEANVNQHVCILRPNDRVFYKYLYLFMCSAMGQSQITMSQVGGGREGLNFESLKSFSIPLPSLNEQQRMVDSIDLFNLRMIQLEILTSRSIDLLKEKRTALISAAVSGQIEIPTEV